VRGIDPLDNALTVEADSTPRACWRGPPLGGISMRLPRSTTIMLRSIAEIARSHYRVPARVRHVALASPLDICRYVHICFVVMTAPAATPTTTRRQRERAARELGAIVDSQLFRALCEPVRIEIVKLLTADGRSDVQTLAAQVPQDQSVVSRHLAVLFRAGVVRREKIGRQVFFELDGISVVTRMERMLEQFRSIIPLCCPAQVDRKRPT
jgi:DNA-binding transcriptional ArsR family regulator